MIQNVCIAVLFAPWLNTSKLYDAMNATNRGDSLATRRRSGSCRCAPGRDSGCCTQQSASSAPAADTKWYVNNLYAKLRELVPLIHYTN